MRIFAMLAALLVTGLSAGACLNLTRTGLDGKPTTIHHFPTKFTDLTQAMERDLATDGASMEAELRTATDINGRSDHAVALLYLGRTQEAVKILEMLEREDPGHYFVAANLGTAYELAGNNSEALRWIKEGIQRNPESHEGTEWLHVRILEAKIKEEQDPTYLDQHTVLDLDPTNPFASVPEAIQSAGNEATNRLKTAMFHQLKERLQFVKPPDAPVAGLLFDLAMLEAGTDSLETAAKLMELAKAYGYSHAKLAPKLGEFETKILWRRFWTTVPWVAGVCGLVILFVLYVHWRTTARLRKLQQPPPIPISS